MKFFNFLVKETDQVEEEIDSNFTGIYGYINGSYIDGSGWIPPDGYVPQERVWYTEAVKAGGKATIVAPYLDAETHTVMVSVSELLSDGESVISLDIALTEIQNITKSMTMNDKGYGFIIDKSGLCIAHLNEAEKGKVYPENEEQKILLDHIYSGASEHFEMTLNGESCTVFSKQIAEEWYVVIVANNTKLLKDLRKQLLICILVSAMVFIIIVIFSTISAVNISRSRKKALESREKLDQLF